MWLKNILLLIFLSNILYSYECKYLDTFINIGKKYDIDYLLLCSIGKVESNYNPYAINARDNNYDIGIMQINSWWIKKLKKRGMYDTRILLDYKYNIDVSGWILKECINSFGIKSQAIDCYNKGSKKAKNNSLYTKKVLKEYNYFIRKINEKNR